MNNMVVDYETYIPIDKEKYKLYIDGITNIQFIVMQDSLIKYLADDHLYALISDMYLKQCRIIKESSINLDLFMLIGKIERDLFIKFTDKAKLAKFKLIT